MASSGAVCFALLLATYSATAEVLPIPADKALETAAVTVHNLLAAPSNGKETLKAVANVYESLVSGRAPNTYPIESSENYALAIQISNDVADLLYNLSSTSFQGSVTVGKVTMMVVKELVNTEEGIRDNFRGEPIFTTDGFSLSAMCLVSEFTHAGFVIFPVSTSPFRSLPDIDVPIHRYRLFELFLIRLKDTAGIGDDTSCSQYEYLDMVVMKRHSERAEPNLRFGCAQWNESARVWKSDACFTVQDLETPTTATCYCDTNQIAKAVQFIMFEYFEDVGLGSAYEEVIEKPANASDLAEVKTYENRITDLASDPTQPASFNMLISKELPLLLQFDVAILVNVNVERVLDDVGAVMTHVVPENGLDIIGRGNQYVSSYMFITEYYRNYPVAGYAFYKDTQMWTDYFRLDGATDWNRLFHDGKSYAFMLSHGVLDQNIRYGFVLYPRDKYLRPVTSIAGRHVVAFRVLDLTLVKMHDLKDKREQLVDMYLNAPAPDDAERTHYGCAYWSNLNETWESAHCKMNPIVYRDVCTCNITSNFNESRTRAQLVAYSYREADLEVAGAEESSEQTDFEFLSTALFALNDLWRYPYGDRTVSKALHLLESVFRESNGTEKLSDATKKKLMWDSRRLFIVNDCAPQQIHAIADSFGALCYDADKPSAVAMAFNRASSYYETKSFTEETFNEESLITNKTVFAVRISDSTARQNRRYAVLVYPNDVNFHPMPRIGRHIIRSRVVDVILVTNNGTDKESQKVELYLDQTEYNATQACAYWTDDWKSWTEAGCQMHQVNGLSVCECSLSIHFQESRAGGQYMVFTFSDIYFNETAYEELPTLPVVDVFDMAAALIHNASMVPLNDELLIKVLRVYMQLMSLPSSTLTAQRPAVDALLDDLALMFSRYRIEPWRQTFHIFGIASSWVVQTADVVKDLFSNAVLSAPSIAVDKTVSSYMLVAVFGYYSTVQGQATGVFFSRGSTEEVLFARGCNNNEALKSLPSFACLFVLEDTLQFYRAVLAVYPLNMSPLPKTLTSQPVFNSRQVDVYIDLNNDLRSVGTKPSLQRPSSVPIDIYFQPTANPKANVKVACAAWVNGTWETNFCSSVDVNNVTVCRCDVAARAVTRIISFEYTTLSNFSLFDWLETKNIIFLIGASLSLLGLVLIAATAVLFRPWRNDLGNKILMHLTASSFLYLSLSIYRVTHYIYSTTNYNNSALVVFTMAVHYSRLSHYCWGLAISILQFMRFSGELGVITTSFLVTKMAVLAWGVPLVPLIVLLSWNTCEHFSSPSKMTHLVIYLVPGGSITLLNIGLLSAIVYKISKKSESASGDLTTRLKTVVLMFFLFGIPTVFEMFNDLWGHSEVVAVINKVLDPIQGFVLFLFFIVGDKQSRGYWMKAVCGVKSPASEGSQMEMTELKGT